MPSEKELPLGQYAALVCALVFSSALSIIGSSTIVHLTRRKLHEPYQRFMCMLSISDIISSTSMFFQQFLQPKDSGGYWSIGSDATCSLVGFFFVFGTTIISLYTAALAVYFLCSVVFNRMPSNAMQRKSGHAERFTHVLCWVLPSLIAIAAAATQSYGFEPELYLCTIYQPCSGVDEAGCVETEISEAYVTFASLILASMHIGTLAICPLIGIVATISLYCYVRKTILRGQRYSFDSDLSMQQKQQLHDVSLQCILYTFGYLVCLGWIIGAIVEIADGSPMPFVLHFFFFLLAPLQGAWNMFVYLRPRFAQLRKRFPNDSFLTSLRLSLALANDLETIEGIQSSARSQNPSNAKASPHSMSFGIDSGEDG